MSRLLNCGARIMIAPSSRIQRNGSWSTHGGRRILWNWVRSLSICLLDDQHFFSTVLGSLNKPVVPSSLEHDIYTLRYS
jgi:hypothetical protein